MIIIAGPIGSGKSEQGQRLAKRLGCPWISSGQLLRENASAGHHAVMKRGKLVDDNYIIKLLDSKFREIDASRKEFILDGTPRTLVQSQWIVRKINNKELKFTAIIVLKVSKEEIIKRMLARGREDDSRQVIDERLGEYNQNTKAAIEHLKMEGLRVNEVDGEQSPDKVEKAIRALLN